MLTKVRILIHCLDFIDISSANQEWLCIILKGDDHMVLSRKDRRVILTWGLYIASLIPALTNLNTG